MYRFSVLVFILVNTSVNEFYSGDLSVMGTLTVPNKLALLVNKEEE